MTINQLAVEAKAVSASYSGAKEPILYDVNLELPQGNFIALIGPNGAGKSTLFKLLVGLKKPEQGSIRLNGDTVKAHRKKQKISYIPQEGELDWDFPILVKDVIKTGLFGKRNYSLFDKLLRFNLYKKEELQKIDEVLELVDLKNKKNSPIKSLSGGQKKRVFLARALIQNAEILLLDEPLTGVDQQSEEIIMDLLKKGAADGKTILMASHDIAATREYADLAILINKTIIKVGDPDELITKEWIKEVFGKSLHYL
ncbi:metal ABC transporter ATP-binding protein [Halanaerobium hydrogeniformans]|uniref:ABC transporter related protein n=1 Tax=Halanaerobium hydrogeniformans TaxID=656519 RepID=E4RLL7_HALHG|nr:metal ABC transporter ATP-binding protein [Halanaerobium hydrogeniformans]ADQ14931.1 ABC transporter related protein [Halanaerobium hydrogeniformans]